MKKRSACTTARTLALTVPTKRSLHLLVTFFVCVCVQKLGLIGHIVILIRGENG